jgi:hypothetical protein
VQHLIFAFDNKSPQKISIGGGGREDRAAFELVALYARSRSRGAIKKPSAKQIPQRSKKLTSARSIRLPPFITPLHEKCDF